MSLDDGVTEVPFGEIGEIIMTGPQVMLGYHGMPTETANTLREKDGKKWVYSGDIARMDEDGYFYIVDRKKDMALIGGFNVYPNTIEKVISDHPAVLEVRRGSHTSSRKAWTGSLESLDRPPTGSDCHRARTDYLLRKTSCALRSANTHCVCKRASKDQPSVKRYAENWCRWKWPNRRKRHNSDHLISDYSPGSVNTDRAFGQRGIEYVRSKKCY